MHFAQHSTPHHNSQALVLTHLYPTLQQCLDVFNLKQSQSQLKLTTDPLSEEYGLIQHAQRGQVIQHIRLKTKELNATDPLQRYYVLSFILNQLK